MKDNENKSIIKFSLICIFIVVTFICAYKFGIFSYISNLLNQANTFIANLGAIGPIVFILIYIIATLLLLPGVILTLGAGLIFGVVKGSILVSIASVLGATASFLVGRYLLRNWVEKQIEKQPQFQAIDVAVAREGWKIVGLTRLSPFFPFVFLNYAFSVTKVSLKDYVLASWIGMMPGTIMYVYIGSIGQTATQGNPFQLALNIVGLVATIAVTVYITRIAKKALAQEID